MSKHFSPRSAAEKVYQAMQEVIGPLSKRDAVEVLETVIEHFEVMLDSFRQQLGDK